MLPKTYTSFKHQTNLFHQRNITRQRKIAKQTDNIKLVYVYNTTVKKKLII